MNDISLPPNSLANRGVGDNSAAAPLAEILAEELAPHRERADELLASAKDARIESATDAGKVADLLVLIRDLERSLDRDRDVRKRPLLLQQRTIEAAYGNVIGPLARARTDTLAPLLTEWQQHNGEAPVTSIAAVGSRRKPDWIIEDLPAVLQWLLLNQPGPLAHSCRSILGNLIHAAGVDAIERGEVQIPGVSISIMKSVQVR